MVESRGWNLSYEELYIKTDGVSMGSNAGS